MDVEVVIVWQSWIVLLAVILVVQAHGQESFEIDSEYRPATCAHDQFGATGVPVCGAANELGLQLSGGVDLTFLKPRFVRNAGFMTLESNGATQESTTVTDFEYDTELSPRVWLQLDAVNGAGFRAQYWQFDHEPESLATSPPANGFGQVTPPEFGDVDISSTIPTDQFSASSGLDAYSIDLEVTKALNCCDWGVTLGGGVARR